MKVPLEAPQRHRSGRSLLDTESTRQKVQGFYAGFYAAIEEYRHPCQTAEGLLENIHQSLVNAFETSAASKTFSMCSKSLILANEEEEGVLLRQINSNKRFAISYQPKLLVIWCRIFWQQFSQEICQYVRGFYQEKENFQVLKFIILEILIKASDNLSWQSFDNFLQSIFGAVRVSIIIEEFLSLLLFFGIMSSFALKQISG